MMNTNTLVIFFILLTGRSLAQTSERVNEFIDLTAAIGKSQGSGAFSYVHNWKLGKARRIEAGLGARLTSSFGEKLDFTTAGPARLTRSFTTPFLIFFAGQKSENWDTLTVQRPFLNALNITINLGYNFSSKFGAGFNIDLIGLSFGQKSSAVFLSKGETRTEPAARPTAFNLLLTGDHDHGTLNSEFFLKYKLNERWSVKGVYQFLFTEYKTRDLNQVAYDGTVIHRFRSKANNFGIGISYNL